MDLIVIISFFWCLLSADAMVLYRTWLDVLPPDEMASHPSGLDGFLGGMGLTRRASSVVTLRKQTIALTR